MDELVELKTGQYNKDEDSFEDHYPIDKLFGL